MTRCRHFGQCGGCSWQDIDYNEQLRLKDDMVEKTFSDMNPAGIAGIKAYPPVWFYRNKMEFSFGTDKDKGPVLGLHKKGYYDRIVDIEECPIFSRHTGSILGLIKQYVIQNGIAPYNPRSHTGVMRHLIFKEAKKTGDIILCLVTTDSELIGLDRLAESLMDKFRQIKGFMWAVNSSPSDTAAIESIRYCKGDMFVTDIIGEYTFRVSIDSFFQPNTIMAYELYETIKSMLGNIRAEAVLDLFSGNGGISTYVSSQVRSIYGVELSEKSVQEAVVNMEKNGIENCRFFHGDVKDILNIVNLKKLPLSYGAIIMDPPRSGVARKTIDRILRLDTDRIIYISCNIKVIKSALSQLNRSGFLIKYVRPVDMFPHTQHIETAVLLEKKT